MSRKWDNINKSVSSGDLAKEMKRFSDEGYELVAAHPLTSSIGLWGYDLFFKREDSN